jgi:hypothetical protein
LAVSEGDVFELSVCQSAGASLKVEAHSQTWFAIEVVEQASPALEQLGPRNSHRGGLERRSVSLD